jgi:DNA-binding transcriptional regulator of glucitol operon
MNRYNILRRLALILIILALCVQFACSPPPPVVKPQNNAPVIENIIYARDAMSNIEVQIECLASDVDGDNLTYQWKAGVGTITGEGKDVLWMPPGKMGTYAITLEVTDSKGGVATENISIRVVTNADGTATPTIEVNLKLGEAQPVVIDKQRARIWTTTDIVCTVENADGNELTYTWTANGGKIQGKGVQEGKANRIGWIAPGVLSDCTIDVTVTDNRGREAKGQVNIHVFCCGN